MRTSGPAWKGPLEDPREGDATRAARDRVVAAAIQWKHYHAERSALTVTEMILFDALGDMEALEAGEPKESSE